MLQHLISDVSFWASVVGAAVLKLLFSPFQSWWKSFSTMVSAVFCAWVFTAPVMDLMGWNPDIYENAVAAVIALMGEGVMRMIIQVWQDPRLAIDFIRAVRGVGK